MYSQKVINRFTNPKFSGEIKNPDAVGEEGNLRCGDIMRIFIKVNNNKISDIKFQTYGCLPPKEKVLVNEGDWREISKVSNSQVVLDGYGIKTKVKKMFKRDYKGKLLKFIPFVSPYNSFYITPEHPILCIQRRNLKKIRKHSKCSWLQTNNDELMSTQPDYVEAGNLKEGDYLVFSFHKGVKDNKRFTKSFLRLLGYYLAEGYISAKNGAVAFSFNKNELKYIEEVKKLIKEITGKDAKFRIRDNVGEVYINSRDFVRKVVKYGNKLARKKKLSEEIMLLPPKKQIEIVETFFNGDGNKYKRRPNNSFTYRLSTTSEKLAIQLQEILARNNIFSSIKKMRMKEGLIEGRRIKGGEIYEVSYRKKRVHKFFHSTGKSFLVPIKQIKVEDYQGPVYNFEVTSNSHSYLVKGFAVHNCVAAIASSDMLCELAKNKTLNEASKIESKDIMKELGEIPAIKAHCSVLGAKALKNAINNYKGAKK